MASAQTILLVEDEEAHAELVERAFERLPDRFRLQVANSLKQARRRLAEHTPDIVVADLLLPDGRGIELLPDGQEPPFPLVVLTSHGNEKIAVEAMKAGALDYVVKSATVLSDMPRVVERALREWRLIAERRRAEEERRQIELRLQHSQKLESLGVLAGGIAHDFNNLVMAIMGHVEIALTDLPQLSPARDSLQDIETVAVRASELCRQLLAYSGKERFVVEPVEINQLVDEMTQLLETAVSKTARITLDLAPDLPPIEAAATQIRQIVMNLITNASDALGGRKGSIHIESGRIEVDADYLETTRMHANASPGPHIYLQVSDSGCGMEPDTQEKIFDPFFTTKASGRGLGMAAVRGIVQSHRGAINLDSRPGVGTTFRVLFPVASGARQPLAKGSQDISQHNTGTHPDDGNSLAGHGADTILVIDDDVTIRAVTTIALEGAGYLVLTAEDGRRGLDLFRQRCDDIGAVLLDLSMPEMSGEDVFAAIRHCRPHVPIIASSGYAEDDVRRRLPQISGYVQKPYQAPDLIAQVRQIMHR